MTSEEKLADPHAARQEILACVSGFRGKIREHEAEIRHHQEQIRNPESGIEVLNCHYAGSRHLTLVSGAERAEPSTFRRSARE